MKGGRPDVLYRTRDRRPPACLHRRPHGWAAVPRPRLRSDHDAPCPAPLARAGIKTAASPHWLRHGFATDLLRRTGGLSLVQAALCHRSITSTLVYARVDA